MFSYTASTIPSNVIVIGGGGTGSRLIPLLTQFLRSITRGVTASGWIELPTIFLIDDDVVEQKNILRQNFIHMDVGKHKAIVLAERYSRAYDVNIVPITERVNAQNENSIKRSIIESSNLIRNGISASFEQIMSSSIVIICVDSVEARRDILNTFIIRHTASGLNTFFIDAGNEDSFGQVSFFNPVVLYNIEQYEGLENHKKLPKMIPVSTSLDYIPMDLEYYKNLVDTPAQGSCADLNQTLAINAIMATSIMGVVQNYYYRKPMNYNCISTSLDGGSMTTFNTFNVFKSRCITERTASNYASGSVYSSELSGENKKLKFGEKLRFSSILSISNKLNKEIVLQKERVEEESRRAEEEARRVEEASRIADEVSVVIIEDSNEETFESNDPETSQAQSSSVSPTAGFPELTPMPRGESSVNVPNAWVTEPEPEPVRAARSGARRRLVRPTVVG